MQTCLKLIKKGLNMKNEELKNLIQWLQWLDQNLDQGSAVLYIAFGSKAEISPQQFHEIAVELADVFQERVKERGIVVREWVDQRAILGHESVQGFLSHCGWNSVLESVCAEVPILAWLMVAEKHLNERMLVEEIKVCLRVETSNGSVRVSLSGRLRRKW
ncbi:hypothetical protein ACSBR1_023209 [Camellia fascicularis]